MAKTIITYKFENLRDQRDAFVKWMDMLHYGMFSDAIEIGPFNSTQFTDGIWVRGVPLDVTEFTDEFEASLSTKKYTVFITQLKDKQV